MFFRFSRRTELLVLAALTIAFLWCAGHFIGIDRHDETVYLDSSRYITFASFFTDTYSPLYATWYGWLGHLCPDPLHRYFLSWALLVSFLVMLPAVLKLPGRWFYALPLITLPILATSPYVSLFAGCIFLSGMCLLLPREGNDHTWSLSTAAWLACVLSFPVAFARPESQTGVQIAAAFTVVVAGVELWRNRDVSTRLPRTLLAIGKILTVLVLAIAMRFVEKSSADTNRSGLAFLQHFNLRASERHLLQPGEVIYRSDYAMRAFHLPTHPGTALETYPLSAYFHANPWLFASHLLRNLFDVRTLFLVAVLLLVWLLPWRRAEDRRLRPASFFLLCISLPPLLGMIVVYPRDHYAITLVPPTAILLMQLLKPYRWVKPTLPWVAAIATVLLCAIGVSVWRMRSFPFDYQREELAEVRCIRDVDRPLAPGFADVIDPESKLAPYLPRARRAVTPPSGTESEMLAWIARDQPVWIAVDPGTTRPEASSSAITNDLLQHAPGYIPHTCPATGLLTVYTR